MSFFFLITFCVTKSIKCSVKDPMPENIGSLNGPANCTNGLMDD